MIVEHFKTSHLQLTWQYIQTELQ